MENKAKYTTVGMFLFTFTIAMVAFILWQARYDVEDLKAKEFRIYSNSSIAGLHKNSSVQYKGLNIGTVKEVRIDPKNLEQIEIILNITKPEIIKVNSYAIIQSLGVTGNKIIEIDGGTKDAKTLEVPLNSYAVLPLEKSFIDEITTQAGDISKQISSILIKFDKLLSDENIKNFNTVLANSNQSTQNLNETLNSMKYLLDTKIKDTIENLNKTSKSINETINNDFKKSLQNITILTSNFNNLSYEVREIINEDVKILLENLNETTNSTRNIDDILYQINSTLEKVNLTIESFEQNGGNMIFHTREITYGPGEENDD